MRKFNNKLFALKTASIIKKKGYAVIPNLISKRLCSKLIKILEFNSKKYLVVKGAFETLSSFDHITEEQRGLLNKFNQEESSKGRRVLLFGYKEVLEDKIEEGLERDLQIEEALKISRGDKNP